MSWGGGMANPFGLFGGPGAPPQGSGAPGGPGGHPDPAQMLFGMPGLFGPGGADPAVLQELLASMGLAGFNLGNPGQPDEQRRVGPPPTSAATIRNLPRIKVTAYDIAANESPECSICLEELVIGQPALRIPCGHLYHEDCVRDWLKKSNECPVCRFELPTDNAEYEKGRKNRMQSRKIRLRQTDLAMKSVQELRRLAEFTGVDVVGCLEKSDIVNRIASSPQVHIISADGLDGSEASGIASPSGTRAILSPSQLESMSMQEIRALMEKLGVDASGSGEKTDLIHRLALAGRVIGGLSAVDAASDIRNSCTGPQPMEVEGAGQAAFFANVANSGRATAESGSQGLAHRSIGQLRQLAKDLGVSLDGCLEKAEIVERLQSAQGALDSL